MDLDAIKEYHNSWLMHLELTTLYDTKLIKEQFEWLMEQAEKYQKIEQAWNKEQNKETIFFLRKCKEIIEGVEIPSRKRMY